MRFLMACICSGWLIAPAQSQEKPSNVVEQIAPFVDESTFFVARVDVSRVDASAALAQFGEWISMDKVKLQHLTANAKQLLSAYEKSGGGPFIVGLSLTDGWNEPFVVIPVERDTTYAFVRNVLSKTFRSWTAVLHRQAIVIGAPSVVKRIQSMTPALPDAIQDEFSTAEPSAIQAVVRLPAVLRKSLVETAPQLPGDIDGEATKQLLHGWDRISFALNTTPELSIRVTLFAKSEETADSIISVIGGLLTQLRNSPQAQKQFGDIGELIPLLRPKAAGNRLRWTFKQIALARIMTPLLTRQRQAAQRQLTHNKLRQMGLAMHNYHDTHKTFPAFASHNKNGKPLLSWRVHVLPYLEQNQLYKQFKLDEPWNSPHNKKLIKFMPDVFCSGNKKLDGKGLTRFLVPFGKKAMFFGKEGVSIRDIRDGTSNTIMIVQASEKQAAIWTKPADLSMKTKDLKKALMGPKEKSFMAVFADGSSHVLPRTVDEKTLRALFTRDGREVVNIP